MDCRPDGRTGVAYRFRPMSAEWPLWASPIAPEGFFAKCIAEKSRASNYACLEVQHPFVREGRRIVLSNSES